MESAWKATIVTSSRTLPRSATRSSASLKPTGSFWLNLGDSYSRKRLLGIPWRVAFHLMDKQGWIVRNSIVWNKIKGGPDNTKDRLRNVHETIFHFVKAEHGYYYDAARSAVRPNARAS